MIKNLEKIFFDFLWEGKPDKIKRAVAFRKIEYGGLNMLDLENFILALKCTWIRRMSLDTTKPWVRILAASIHDFEVWTHFGVEFLSQLQTKTSNTFWKDVYMSVRQLNQKTKITNESEFQQSPILYNSKILIK